MEDNIVVTINGHDYVPKMPKHWFAQHCDRVYTTFYDHVRFNPITNQLEKCNVHRKANCARHYFVNHIICYDVLIWNLNENVILQDGSEINSIFVKAIRNWQLHNRCFDYMECPFVNCKRIPER